MSFQEGINHVNENSTRPITNPPLSFLSGDSEQQQQRRGHEHGRLRQRRQCCYCSRDTIRHLSFFFFILFSKNELVIHSTVPKCSFFCVCVSVQPFSVDFLSSAAPVQHSAAVFTTNSVMEPRLGKSHWSFVLLCVPRTITVLVLNPVQNKYEINSSAL